MFKPTFRPFGKFNNFKDRKRINEWIQAKEVMVIDEKGQRIGVMPTFRALELARQKKLDLMEVSAKAQPPVCRIIDYGKYQYQQEKKARAGRGKQIKTEVKGIRIKIKTAPNDLNIKAKQAEKFLKRGHKVKIEILLRGREKAFFNLALERIKEFAELIGIEKEFEQTPKKTPRGFNAIIVKKK